MTDLLTALGGDKTARAQITLAQAPSTEVKSCAWNWHDDANDIILHEQPQTAIYLNGCGGISIRQVDNCGSDDSIVAIRCEFAERLCAAIMRLAREAGGADA